MNERVKYIIDNVDVWWDTLTLYVVDGHLCTIQFFLNNKLSSMYYNTYIYFLMDYGGSFYFDTIENSHMISINGMDIRLTNGEQEAVLNMIYNNIENTIKTNPAGIKKLTRIIPPYISNKYPEIFSGLELGLL